MATTIEFSDDAVKLIEILKKKFNATSKRAVLEKILKIAAVLAHEQDEKGCVTYEKRDGSKTRLMLRG